MESQEKTNTKRTVKRKSTRTDSQVKQAADNTSVKAAIDAMSKDSFTKVATDAGDICVLDSDGVKYIVYKGKNYKLSAGEKGHYAVHVPSTDIDFPLIALMSSGHIVINVERTTADSNDATDAAETCKSGSTEKHHCSNGGECSKGSCKRHHSDAEDSLVRDVDCKDHKGYKEAPPLTGGDLDDDPKVNKAIEDILIAFDEDTVTKIGIELIMRAMMLAGYLDEAKKGDYVTMCAAIDPFLTEGIITGELDIGTPFDFVDEDESDEEDEEDCDNDEVELTDHQLISIMNDIFRRLP